MIRPLRVLMYHRILEKDAQARWNGSGVSATPEAFREQMRWVATHYRVLSLGEVLDRLREGRPLPGRALAITFDDGCRDFGRLAWPILRAFRLPAAVFVPTAYPGSPGRTFWWDRLHAAFESTRRTCLATPCGLLHLATPEARLAGLRAVRRYLKTIPHVEAMPLVDGLCRALGEGAPPRADVLDWSELRALAADGVAVGAHSRTHPALTTLPAEEARAEIGGAAKDIERELGRRPTVFAYPFGDYDERVVRMVKDEGFEMALTCRDGQSWLPGADPLRVRRTGITPRTSLLVFRGRLTTAGSYVDRWRHRRRAESGAAGTTAECVAPADAPKIAYIMSRFPKLSETFVLNEIVTCSSVGVSVEVFPLLRERQRTVHPEIDEWVGRAHFHPFLSLPILRANLRVIRDRPAAYLRLLAEVLRGTWGSPNFFVGAIGIFPKAVRIAGEMRDRGVTHIHAHFATHPALAALIVHRLTGIAYSFTAHGSDLHVDRRMLDAKLEAASFAVTVSQFNRDLIVRELGDALGSKVHVVHCGVDPHVFAPRADDAPSSERLQIVCVASFEEVKGHRYLIDACRMLRERGVPFDCHLVGEGPLRKDVERRVAAAGLAQRVRLHGGQPRPAVARLLSQSDVAVLASHPTRKGKREGIPVALMEAMAAGLPVVATAISGIPELVLPGLTGVLVPSGSAVALADALERLEGDRDLRARMGKAGRARVMRAFDLRAGALELLRLFTAAQAGEQLDDASDVVRAHAS